MPRQRQASIDHPSLHRKTSSTSHSPLQSTHEHPHHSHRTHAATIAEDAAIHAVKTSSPLSHNSHHNGHNSHHNGASSSPSSSSSAAPASKMKKLRRRLGLSKKSVLFRSFTRNTATTSNNNNHGNNNVNINNGNYNYINDTMDAVAAAAADASSKHRVVTIHESDMSILNTATSNTNMNNSATLSAGDLSPTGSQGARSSTMTFLAPPEIPSALSFTTLSSPPPPPDHPTRPSFRQLPLQHANTYDASSSSSSSFPMKKSTLTDSSSTLPKLPFFRKTTTTDPSSTATATARKFTHIPLQRFKTIEPMEGFQQSLHYRMAKRHTEQSNWTVHAFDAFGKKWEQLGLKPIDTSSSSAHTLPHHHHTNTTTHHATNATNATNDDAIVEVNDETYGKTRPTRSESDPTNEKTGGPEEKSSLMTLWEDKKHVYDKVPEPSTTVDKHDVVSYRRKSKKGVPKGK